MPEPTTVRVVVTGRVQGVFYRSWTVEQARARGVRGWVRNRADGCVEALFSGEADAVDALVEACRQGPPRAEVDDVEVNPADEPVPGDFDQVASA